MNGDQLAMEELLYETVQNRWGKEKLPGLIPLIMQARREFELGLKDATDVVRSLFQHHQSDFETMGYKYEPFEVPTPPKYVP